MYKSVSERMHGVVLCAGLGTRLRPLTHVLPKPAVPVGELPAALRNVEQLLNAGFGMIHCNTHYLANELQLQLTAAARSRGWPPEKIRFWHEAELLETGGGIAQIVKAVSAENSHNTIWDTMVVSGDIVAEIPTAEMLKCWSNRTPTEHALMASIPLDKPRKDVTWVNSSLTHICGFGQDSEVNSQESQNWKARVFSNHQIISGELMASIQIEKKSSIDLFYRYALRSGKKILHLPIPENSAWFDIGTPESYFQCLNQLSINRDYSDLVIQIVIKNEEANASDQSKRSIEAHQEHSDSCATNPDSICLSMLQQKNWRWMGYLHMPPSVLETGLLKLLMEIKKERSPQGPLDEFVCLQAGGSLLNNLNPPKPSLPPSALSLATQGFFEVSLSSKLWGSLDLRTPILVPFDLLLPPHLSPKTQSPFWVLFTQSLQ